MAKIKKSLIVTVFNEEKTISSLIDSILKQSELPSEIIIVDGGSKDETLKVVRQRIQESRLKNRFKVYLKKGNRSIGRNEAIRRSKAKVIAITDAGCILDKNWFRNITKPFEVNLADVVSGYYKARPGSIFEKSLVPYVLVMPDRVNPADFLPATRSMAINKSAFIKAGGFDEKLSNNEDYAFARKLKNMGFTIRFVKNAIVYWIPRVNLKQTFIMFFRFALGDAEAGILRPKVILVFSRYVFAFILLFMSLPFLSVLALIYILWSINKNYKYVKNVLAIVFLPLIQFTADLAVISGTTLGFLRIFDTKWEKWVVNINKKVKLYEHFNILAVSLFISICLFTVLSVSFPRSFAQPSQDVINWYSVNNYPKQADYFYFETGFVFITLTTLFLWVLKIWAKAKK